MTERWSRVGRLFDRALAATPHDRQAVIDAAADSDEVKNEVRSLLDAHGRADDFLTDTEHRHSARADGNRDASADFPPDAAIGPYRIVTTIGRGGMGVVYAAEDTRLHRKVALKALPVTVASDERQRRRLRQEARAAALLQHPGIATVYALEEIDDQVFISSEYLEGVTLRSEMERGAQDAPHTLAAGVEIAKALVVAHGRGVVHRDLKPENVFRTSTGTLKILDFGLAQFDPAAGEPVSHSRLTQPGMLTGTPAYMAPEQLLGHPVDFRCDHFALGVLLYEMRSGRHPFAHGSLPSTMARVLAVTPDALPGPSATDRELWRVVERCLRKEPAERFASTTQLQAALEAALENGMAAGSNTTWSAAPTVDSSLSVEQRPSHAVAWWRFHQLAAVIAYAVMVWPAWHVHRSMGRAGLFFFFALVAAVALAGNLRLHLWFSSRVYPERLAAQRLQVATALRAIDLMFAILLVGGGIALPEARAGWAALFISFGLCCAVASLIIEPATAHAAFAGDDV